MMPICDQTTIALMMRSAGTAPSSIPIHPVLPRPMPAPAAISATSQSATLPALPATGETDWR